MSQRSRTPVRYFPSTGHLPNEQETQAMAQRYREGIAWGVMKQELFEYVNEILKEPRVRYEELIAHPEDIEKNIGKSGQCGPENIPCPFLIKLKKSVGIQSLL